MSRTSATVLIIIAFLAAAGFYLYSRSLVDSPEWIPAGGAESLPGTNSGYGRYGTINPRDISFSDTAESNSDLEVPIGELTLVNEDFEDVRLADVQGDGNLLLVVIRGVPLCPFCTAQTSRLVSNYRKFQERGSEVAVVFPGTRDHLKELLMRAEVDDQQLPFPILVDTDLTIVKRLDIEGNKAAPSTFIIDAGGRTRFAYVGANDSDRPSIAALLNALDRIRPDGFDADESRDSITTEGS